MSTHRRHRSSSSYSPSALRTSRTPDSPFMSQTIGISDHDQAATSQSQSFTSNIDFSPAALPSTSASYSPSALRTSRTPDSPFMSQSIGISDHDQAATSQSQSFTSNIEFSPAVHSCTSATYSPLSPSHRFSTDHSDAQVTTNHSDAQVTTNHHDANPGLNHHDLQIFPDDPHFDALDDTNEPNTDTSFDEEDEDEDEDSASSSSIIDMPPLPSPRSILPSSLSLQALDSLEAGIEHISQIGQIGQIGQISQVRELVRRKSARFLSGLRGSSSSNREDETRGYGTFGTNLGV
ncbi:hypothetical protein TREMEDRAFT_61173 [Tremella mesenterica DSM 1558]|uniref:uncharacterized protein n=1 Tax=Tremella mesenterica (strain ATCC 24925 / CBS 8224 / DSM 1558 / NBRC 9311 / NRRL Y-6157 / RJB 2259-6 / UBC 559-6) TaxID=578456 RepID=UPI0003F496E7|nr:uncharacterized protein TREMEDRAFT_61173 [Tremella mesenterica DSM 1558]EIW70665.1 hypothetical protein TREMEDRAFT_61173 [Tremella mesenterica DSM 1558]